MKESSLLNSFNGTNQKIPVWFMRQAGRFLPEYREIRKTRSLDEMFRDPDTVAEVTCLPVNILNVDAAILFADILTLPMHLGFDITFDPNKGPIIQNPLNQISDTNKLHPLDDVMHLRKAIPLITKSLPTHVPLIGFAGAPFTVLCYLIEGGSSSNFRKVFRWMNQDPKGFHQMMRFLTDNTIAYLNLQKSAGIQVFQLFDTWGGILPAHDFRTFILPYLSEVFREVDLPSIYYLKNSRHLLSLSEQCGSDFLSVCETIDFEDTSILNNSKQGIQGNLFQGLLYSQPERLESETLKILKNANRFNKYIFNISHGIQPDVPVANVLRVIDIVHAFKRDHHE